MQETNINRADYVILPNKIKAQMKYLVAIFLSCIVFFSCGENQSNSYSTKDQVSLHIEGMTCEKMCGGTICKSLEKLEGVSKTDLAFDTENPVDVVTVTYDADKISAEEMIHKVESLANGAYEVKNSVEI